MFNFDYQKEQSRRERERVLSLVKAAGRAGVINGATDKDQHIKLTANDSDQQ